MQYWKLGLEEAEELLARRAGLQPATDHEPVDFATKKTNFSSLARAWAGGSGSAGKQQSSLGAGSSLFVAITCRLPNCRNHFVAGAAAARAPDRSKPNSAQIEPPKAAAPSTAALPDAKSTATAVPPPKSHRASGQATGERGRRNLLLQRNCNYL